MKDKKPSSQDGQAEGKKGAILTLLRMSKDNPEAGLVHTPTGTLGRSPARERHIPAACVITHQTHQKSRFQPSLTASLNSASSSSPHVIVYTTNGEGLPVLLVKMTPTCLPCCVPSHCPGSLPLSVTKVKDPQFILRTCLQCRLSQAEIWY